MMHSVYVCFVSKVNYLFVLYCMRINTLSIEADRPDRTRRPIRV